MRLYIDGHNHRLGYVISREYSNAECSEYASRVAGGDGEPLRHVASLRKARALVERYNRRFGTH